MVNLYGEQYEFFDNYIINDDREFQIIKGKV